MSGDGQDEACLPDLWIRIDDLDSELSTLKAQREWVSVEERLPELDEMVLLAHFYNGERQWMTSGCIDEDGWWCEFADSNFDSTCFHTVTHWQPLPPAPEVK